MRCKGAVRGCKTLRSSTVTGTSIDILSAGLRAPEPAVLPAPAPAGLPKDVLRAKRAELLSAPAGSAERQKEREEGRPRLRFCGVELRLVAGLESKGHSHATGDGETCMVCGKPTHRVRLLS